MSVQSSSLLNRRRVRRTFGKIKEVAQMPNLMKSKEILMNNFYKCMFHLLIELMLVYKPFLILFSQLKILLVDLCWSLFLTHWKSQNMMLRNATNEA